MKRPSLAWMLACLPLLAAAGLWLAARGDGEPPPAGGDPPSRPPARAEDLGPPHQHFPLTPGNIWVYEVEDPARGAYKERFEFSGVQEIDERAFALVTHVNDRDGNYRSESLFAYGPAGVELYRVTTALGQIASSLRFGRPRDAMLTLPLELKAGRRWEQVVEAASTLTGRSTACRVRGEVVGEESVSVPAGTFTAWRIRVVQRLEEEETETIGWYSYLVGQVQFEQQEGARRVVHRLAKALVNGRHFPAPPDEVALLVR